MEHNNSQKLMLSARFIYQCVIAIFCFSVLFANTSFAQSCEEAIQSAKSACSLLPIVEVADCMYADDLSDASYTNPSCKHSDSTPTGINFITKSCFRSAQSCLKTCGLDTSNDIRTKINPNISDLIDALIQYQNTSLSKQQKKCLEPAKRLSKFMKGRIDNDETTSGSTLALNRGKGMCRVSDPNGRLNRHPEKGQGKPEATDFKESCQKMEQFIIGGFQASSYDRNSTPAACEMQGLSWNADENRCWDPKEEATDSALQACLDQGKGWNHETGNCYSTDESDDNGQAAAPLPFLKDQDIGGKTPPICPNTNQVRNEQGICVDPPATCDPTVDTARCSPEQLVNLKTRCEAQGKVWNGKSCENKVSSAEEDPNDDGDEEEEDAETASPDSPGDQTPGDNEGTNKDLKNLEQALKNASDNLGGGGGGQNSGGGNNGIPNVGSVSVGGNNDGFGSSDFDGGGDDSRSSSELSVSPPSTRSITPLFRGRTPIVGVEQKGQQRADGGGANNQGGGGGLGGNPGGLGGGNKGKPQKVKGAGRRGKSRLWEAAKQLVTGSYFGGGGGGAATGGNNKYRQTAKRKSKRFLPNGRGGYVDTQGMTGAELNALNKSFRSNIPGYKPAPASHGLLGDKYNRLVTTILKNEVMLNRYGCEPPLTSCDAVKRMTASSKRKRKPSSVRSKKKRTKKRYKKRRKKRRKKRK